MIARKKALFTQSSAQLPVMTGGRGATKQKIVIEGDLRTSFAMIGSIHFSLDSGNFDSRQVNDVLRALKNRSVRITVEGLW